MGAHARGHNRDSVGTCLIGKTEFTEAQFKSLKVLHNILDGIFPGLDYYPHNHFSQHKTCPNFDVYEVMK